MTPCSRPENLSKIKETIPNQCTWVVLYDQSVGNDVECISDVCFYSENTGHYGNPLRNEFLNLFSDKFTDDDWVYILDDDNIIHPEWYSTISNLIDNEDQNINFINWGQVGGVATTKLPKVGNIDTACFMYKPKAFGEIRYEMCYTSDGIFAETIFELSNPKTIMKELAYYNFLNPNSNKPSIDIDKIKMDDIHPTLLQFLYQQKQNT